MLTKEQEEQAREIARDITERADKGEFGYRIGFKEIKFLSITFPP